MTKLVLIPLRTSVTVKRPGPLVRRVREWQEARKAVSNSTASPMFESATSLPVFDRLAAAEAALAAVDLSLSEDDPDSSTPMAKTLGIMSPAVQTLGSAEPRHA